MTPAPVRRYDLPVQIETGKRVRMKVHLAVVDGSTLEDIVVEYIQGSGKMLPGLEAAVQGLEGGAKKRGVLRAAQAFGDPVHSPRKTMKRAEFPPEARLAAGERFAAKGVNGVDVVLLIHEMTGEEVVVQLLHPLADKDLEYSVEVLSVTDPQPPPFPSDALNVEDA
jgi:FKBP-type peptidyl-prolyl cis-trans isomerase 2